MNIEEARKKINEIDKEMASLFEQRMEITREIGRYKKDVGMPIYDPNREKMLIDKNISYISDEEISPYYRRFEAGVMALSKEYQRGRNKIIFGKGILDKFGDLFEIKGKVFVVCDSNVPKKYINEVVSSLENRGCKVFSYTIRGGESCKTFFSIQNILSEIFASGIKRNDQIVAIGGGAVLDAAGFASSIYLRGVPCFYVPTTLLSAADASVGGKTAIDFESNKNTVGAFCLPAGVIIDTNPIDELEQKQKNSGMAEIIKIAAVLDKNLFEKIEEGRFDLLDLIKRAVELKSEIVGIDFRDEGTRRVLNFGHTVGHAIETESGLLHGEAICPGMICMSEGEARSRIEALLKKYNLPTRTSIRPTDLLPHILKDKKSDDDGVNCVICNEIGSYKIEKLSRNEISDRIMRIKK